MKKRREIEKIIGEIVQDWFLSEPILFAIFCTHELVEKNEILVPFRTGKRRIEFNPPFSGSERYENFIFFDKLMRTENRKKNWLTQKPVLHDFPDDFFDFSSFFHSPISVMNFLSPE